MSDMIERHPGQPIPKGADCDTCHHPFDPHVFIALGEPIDGGFILCPDKGCDCYGTFSAGNLPVLNEPPEDVVEFIRQQIQDGNGP